MKAIVVGATGFIGTAILRRALDTPAITSIVTLSRRDLPSDVASHSKLKNVIVADFTDYSPEVIRELVGAELCIWAMGGRVPQFPDLAAARTANVTNLHAFARVLASTLTSTTVPAPPSAPKFRFVYCSGALTEQDQSARLLFLADSRKLKGEAEAGLLEIEREHAALLEVLIARPAGVLERDGGVMGLVYGRVGIGKEVLAAAMVEMGVAGVTDGGFGGKVVESAELRRRGRQILK